MADPTDFKALQLHSDTHDRILNAAMACLIQYGPKRTNISSVAAMAGVSRPTVYAHFDSLETLFSHAIRRGTDLLAARMFAQVMHIEDLGERLIEAFMVVLDLTEQVPLIGNAMDASQDLSGEDVLPDEAVDIVREIFDTLLEGFVGEGQTIDDMAETVIRFFLSLAAFKRPHGKEETVRDYLKVALLPALGIQRPS